MPLAPINVTRSDSAPAQSKKAQDDVSTTQPAIVVTSHQSAPSLQSTTSNGDTNSAPMSHVSSAPDSPSGAAPVSPSGVAPASPSGAAPASPSGAAPAPPSSTAPASPSGAAHSPVAGAAPGTVSTGALQQHAYMTTNTGAGTAHAPAASSLTPVECAPEATRHQTRDTTMCCTAITSVANKEYNGSVPDSAVTFSDAVTRNNNRYVDTTNTSKTAAAGDNPAVNNRRSRSNTLSALSRQV